MIERQLRCGALMECPLSLDTPLLRYLMRFDGENNWMAFRIIIKICKTSSRVCRLLQTDFNIADTEETYFLANILYLLYVT